MTIGEVWLELFPSVEIKRGANSKLMSLSRDREAPTGNTRHWSRAHMERVSARLASCFENSRFSKEAILRVNALNFLF